MTERHYRGRYNMGRESETGRQTLGKEIDNKERQRHMIQDNLGEAATIRKGRDNRARQEQKGEAKKTGRYRDN